MVQQSAGRLEEIETFVAVAETGSFTAAAARLGRDATVLSRRVSTLEARLGVRLLTRTTRRVTPTEAGIAYLRRAQAALTELAAADAEASDRAAQPRGILRLALPAAFGRLWIAPLLPGFLATHPAVQVEAYLSDRFVDLPAEGMDAAVRVGPMPDSSLIVRRIAPSRRLLVAAPGYLAARGVPGHPDDLAGHVCLGFTRFRSWPDWRLRRGAEEVAIRTGGALVSDDGEALMAAALGGTGIMLASDWLVGIHVSAGRLVEVLPDWTAGEEEGVHAVLPAGRLVPAKARVFVDWIAAAFAPVTPWRRPS